MYASGYESRCQDVSVRVEAHPKGKNMPMYLNGRRHFGNRFHAFGGYYAPCGNDGSFILEGGRNRREDFSDVFYDLLLLPQQQTDKERVFEHTLYFEFNLNRLHVSLLNMFKCIEKKATGLCFLWQYRGPTDSLSFPSVRLTPEGLAEVFTDVVSYFDGRRVCPRGNICAGNSNLEELQKFVEDHFAEWLRAATS